MPAAELTDNPEQSETIDVSPPHTESATETASGVEEVLKKGEDDLTMLRSKHPLPLHELHKLAWWENKDISTTWWGMDVTVSRRLKQDQIFENDEEHGADPWHPKVRDAAIGPMYATDSCFITLDGHTVDLLDESSWKAHPLAFKAVMESLMHKWEMEQTAEAVVLNETEDEARYRLADWVFQPGNLPEIKGVEWKLTGSNPESVGSLSEPPAIPGRHRVAGATEFFDTHSIALVRGPGQEEVLPIGYVTFRKGGNSGKWYTEVVSPPDEEGYTYDFSERLKVVLRAEHPDFDLRTVDIKITPLTSEAS
jgi:hypothetical protein